MPKSSWNCRGVKCTRSFAKYSFLSAKRSFAYRFTEGSTVTGYRAFPSMSFSKDSLLGCFQPVRRMPLHAAYRRALVVNLVLVKSQETCLAGFLSRFLWYPAISRSRAYRYMTTVTSDLIPLLL